MSVSGVGGGECVFDGKWRVNSSVINQLREIQLIA